MDGKVKEIGVTTISSKNQITIPVAVLRQAGLKPGDRISVTSGARGELEVNRVTDLIEKYAGSLPNLDRSILDRLDDEWE